MFELYSYYRSSAAYRVRIILHYKGIPFRQTPISLVAGEQREEAFLAVNPQGLVPALRLPDGEVLTQSTAILEWLEEAYPERACYPTDPLARARARALCQVIANDVHPVNNLRVQQYLKGDLGLSAEQNIAWMHHWMALGFGAIEQQLVAGPFALGDTLSMVDAYLIPQVYNALRFELDMTSYPKIDAVYQHCTALEYFKAAAPEAQPDAPTHS